MTTFYLVRHGESKGNLHFAVSGESLVGVGELGTDLTEKGKEQVVETRNKLRGIHFDAIYSSDLARAHESALIFADHLNLPVTTTDRLREKLMGSLSGKRSSVLKEEFKEKYQELEKLSHEAQMEWKLVPDMENANESAKRLRDFLKELSLKHDKESVLVVTHGGLMRFFLMTLGFAKYSEFPGGSIENAGFVKIAFDDHGFEIVETYKINKI